MDTVNINSFENKIVIIENTKYMITNGQLVPLDKTARGRPKISGANKELVEELLRRVGTLYINDALNIHNQVIPLLNKYEIVPHKDTHVSYLRSTLKKLIRKLDINELQTIKGLMDKNI